MKKIYLFVILLQITINANSQSYIGFLTDNYKGVHGIINNPASIADSRLKADINLAGASALLGNDYFGFTVSDIFDDDYEIDNATRFPADENTVFGNVDILGPSFMINLNEKSAIALFTRARAFYNINGVNGNNIDELNDGFNNNEDISANIGNAAFASGNAWAEAGVSYARTLIDKDQHFLKGGISLKYLIGLGNTYATANDLTIDLNNNDIAPGETTLGSVTTSGELTYGYSENLEGDVDDLDNLEALENGFGVDLGFIYEWRPEAKNFTYKNKNGNTSYYKDVNKYKLKLGLSLTDLGSLNYEGIEETFNIDGVEVSKDKFEDIEGREELEELYSFTASDKTEGTVLPTALHFNADWNFNHKFYLNLNTDLSLISKDEINRNQIANTLSLTPRFERKWFTFQMPLTVQQYSGFHWGAGFRAGPLYIGSGSILTTAISDKAKAIDIYAGLKIPIYQSRPKDKDNDGVFDKLDNCPDEAGPIENAGCPWTDSDGDTLLDNEDNCPSEAGPVNNQGCPWGDRDNDGITDNLDECIDQPGKKENNGCPVKDSDGDTINDKDDNCPFEAGPLNNQGCPWGDKDGDGVTDNIDECPTTAGTTENKGCPEVTAEVQKTLNSYAKTILFDSGKSSIKTESDQVLIDILTILKEYSNAQFNIEGHTDSAGSNSLNQKLSDSRANAVKVYLVEKGIDESRLKAIGYGENKPISSNATRSGRAKNRRVEINLVK